MNPESAAYRDQVRPQLIDMAARGALDRADGGHLSAPRGREGARAGWRSAPGGKIALIP
jgi:hypothetical protein